ncbi:MAG: hypothetical protein HOO87_04250 [Methyloglobulus sp.]|nr:hypothetical protein [Methyloglobulus sp.]
MTHLSLLICLIVALSNCSILPKAQPSAVHDLGYSNSDAPSLIKVPSQQAPITVEASKWLLDNRIRYRLLYADPTEVRFYSLDRWIAPPPELFEQLLNASGKHWTKALTINLHVFEQQFTMAKQAKVVMYFTATTTHAHVDKVIKQDFHLHLPCPTPDAKGAVSGFTLLTRQAIDKIQAWLEETRE